MTFSSKIHGIVFVLLLAIGASTIWVFVVPSLILLPLHFQYVVRLRRKYIQFWTGFYLDFASSLLVGFCGTKVYLYGKNLSALSDTGRIVISNHMTRVDWMFVGWCYNAFSDLNRNCHVILKESLKSVPIFGWTMQMMVYIFLERSREKDIPHIRRSLHYLRGCDPDTSILIFPEGSDLSEENIEKNNKFARANNLQELYNVIYPKPTGIETCLKSWGDLSRKLHDLTVAYVPYPGEKRCSELSLLLGHFPKEVHIFIDRFTMEDIPSERTLLAQWLKDRFYIKENLLAAFNRQMESKTAGNIVHRTENSENSSHNIDSCPQNKVSNESSSLFTLQDVSTTKEFESYKLLGSSLCPPSLKDSGVSKMTKASFHQSWVWMGLLSTTLVVLTITSTWMKQFLTLAVITSVLGKFANGWDNLELALHDSLFSKSPEDDSHHTHHHSHHSNHHDDKDHLHHHHHHHHHERHQHHLDSLHPTDGK